MIKEVLQQLEPLDAQIDALLWLLTDLAARYAIPAANYVGHADVAPGRKVEPERARGVAQQRGIFHAGHARPHEHAAARLFEHFPARMA